MEYHVRTGEIPPRTGNRQSALASAPYNAFPTADGWVAIHVVTEAHWKNLAKAMGREELADDPRFATNAARVANLEATDEAVAAWTRTLGKLEVFAATRRYRIPCAPVRTVPEVMNDPHMHGRGMLERIDHPELGNIVVPTIAAASAWRGARQDGAQPDDRAAQRRGLRRLAGAVGGRDRDAEGRGRRSERQSAGQQATGPPPFDICGGWTRNVRVVADDGPGHGCIGDRFGFPVIASGAKQSPSRYALRWRLPRTPTGLTRGSLRSSQ